MVSDYSNTYENGPPLRGTMVMGRAAVDLPSRSPEQSLANGDGFNDIARGRSVVVEEQVG